MAYATARFKGRELLRLMRASDKEAGQYRGNANESVQSEYLTQNAFQQEGWAPYPDDNYNKDDVLNRLSEALEIDKSSNIHIGHHHKGSDVQQGKPTTNAHFDTVINPPAVIIVVVNSRSPTKSVESGRADEWRQGDQLPDLKFWSDVAYLQWTSVTDESSDLRYVIRLNITNERTKAVIGHIMTQPSLIDRYPMFPGISWSLYEDEEVAALLGTPNGIGVAWLLIQHKAQLGHKIVKKVTLVYKDWLYLKEGKVPTLIFEFGNVVAAEKTKGEESAEERLQHMRIE